MASSAPSTDMILAIDQGTTGSTAYLVDTKLRKIAEHSIDYPQHFPSPGWVEHDPAEILSSVAGSIAAVLKDRDTKKICAIGITNQRETVCFWDRKAPLAEGHLGKAIVWQDRRTAETCKKLKSDGCEPDVTAQTGLLLDPYFSATKVAWAISNRPAVKAALNSGTLAVGTIDSFLLWHLTGGEIHRTEPSNASRTLCFDLEKGQFTDSLCKLFKAPTTIWPEIAPSFGLFGKTKGFPGLPNGIPITGILGDQQSALLGQGCIKPGQAKCTYGTGSFLLVNSGTRRPHSIHRLLTTIAWSSPSTGTVYALEGSAFIAGAAVQWLRDGLGIIKSSSEIENLARSVPDSGETYFVPALTGLGAPHWNPDARGVLCGITRGTTAAHLARATLEGIAYQNADLLDAMQADLDLGDSGPTLVSLNVDGGASANDLLMQFQAETLGIQLRRPKVLETTSLGAIFAAGLGAGVWKSLEEVEKSWVLDRTFEPTWDSETRELKMEGWKKAVARSLL